MSRATAWVIAIALAGTAIGSTFAFWNARKEHRHLADEFVRAREQDADTTRLRADDARLVDLIALRRSDRSQADAALHDELARAQPEVEELERKAVADRDVLTRQSRERIEALQANADLTKGPMLIENCADIGRATPEAALQTLIWAAAHGHDDVVRSTLTFDAATRALAQAAVAALPESSRAEYQTPEALGALFVAQVVNDLTGIQVLDRTANGNDIVLTLGGLQKQLGKVTMTQSADGWQVVIDSGGFERIRRMLLIPRK